MKPHLNFSQLTLLVGTALGVGVALVLIIYFFRKAARQRSQVDEFTPPSPRTENAPAFALATMQGVITNLREEQKKVEELLRLAERRADESAQWVERLAQEIEEGLMIFDCEGFIGLSNPAARAILGIDTWSRRRYTEILGNECAVTKRIQACLESGEGTRQEEIEYLTGSGETQPLVFSVLPVQGRNGEIWGAVCLVRRRKTIAGP